MKRRGAGRRAEEAGEEEAAGQEPEGQGRRRSRQAGGKAVAQQWQQKERDNF